MSKCRIELENVKKIYNPGLVSEVRALDGVSLKVMKGEFISIFGPSGSGKTTLLDVLGCLLRSDSGKVIIDGVNTKMLNDSGLAKIRCEKLGFIFQQYNLIHSLTALENISIALRIAGKSKKESFNRSMELLEMVGLKERAKHMPSELSGGEQQRVAIARALANDPEIIVGDEPTGNLDTKTGEKILKLLTDLKKKGYTIILVTHDARIAKHSDKIINIMDGKIGKRRNHGDGL